MTDIIVIGAGPAGLTAAVYACRAGKSVLVIEKGGFGGQITFSPKVENFPGKTEISGMELAEEFTDHAIAMGAELTVGTVEKIEKADGIFRVVCDDETYEAKAVIIANGVKQKHLNIEAEEKFIGNGVYYCAICDGAFFSGKEVAVVGDGNSALQTAIYLSSICTKVHVLTWFDKYFGDQSLIDVLKKTDNIVTVPNVNVVDFLGKEELIGVKCQSQIDGSTRILNVPAVFVAIGQIPDNKRYANLVDLDENGYILADEDLKTRTDGLFVAGDTRRKTIRQLTTAVGDGTIAAMSAIEYIMKN